MLTRCTLLLLLLLLLQFACGHMPTQLSVAAIATATAGSTRCASCRTCCSSTAIVLRVWCQACCSCWCCWQFSAALVCFALSVAPAQFENGQVQSWASMSKKGLQKHIQQDTQTCGTFTKVKYARPHMQ